MSGHGLACEVYREAAKTAYAESLELRLQLAEARAEADKARAAPPCLDIERLVLEALDRGIEQTTRDWKPNSPQTVAVEMARTNVRLAIRAALAKDE